MSNFNTMKIDLSSRHSTKLEYQNLSKRKTTEAWLKDLVKEREFKFRYSLTLSFYKPQRCVINQYLDNEHIKKVILDFFYPNNKPKNRIRFWLFVEKHKDADLHLHILMEGMDEMEWLSKRNRKITIKKTTLLDVIQGNYSIREIMLESLAYHLKAYILRLGKGKQSFNAKDIGEVDWRIEYLNKSLDSWDFNGWEHLDVENSDMDATHITNIQ